MLGTVIPAELLQGSGVSETLVHTGLEQREVRLQDPSPGTMVGPESRSEAPGLGFDEDDLLVEVPAVVWAGTVDFLQHKRQESAGTRVGQAVPAEIKIKINHSLLFRLVRRPLSVLWR